MCYTRLQVIATVCVRTTMMCGMCAFVHVCSESTALVYNAPYLGAQAHSRPTFSRQHIRCRHCAAAARKQAQVPLRLRMRRKQERICMRRRVGAKRL